MQIDYYIAGGIMLQYKLYRFLVLFMQIPILVALFHRDASIWSYREFPISSLYGLILMQYLWYFATTTRFRATITTNELYIFFHQMCLSIWNTLQQKYFKKYQNLIFYQILKKCNPQKCVKTGNTDFSKLRYDKVIMIVYLIQHQKQCIKWTHSS